MAVEVMSRERVPLWVLKLSSYRDNGRIERTGQKVVVRPVRRLYTE